MGMFSTKPPFNLAEFLAQKAPAKTSRYRRGPASQGSVATPASKDQNDSKNSTAAVTETTGSAD